MLIIQRPQVEAGEPEGNLQTFTIGPLEPGFGHTLGNSLRRTLLSSIPGAAVTQVRFDEALHEFTTLPGVKEDVTDIILNLKQVPFKMMGEGQRTAHIRVEAPGEVGQRRHPQLAFLGREVWRVVSADAVLMADGAAVLDDDIAGRGLHRPPLGQRPIGVGAAGPKIRHVDAGAVGVDVRQVGEDEHAPVQCLGCGLDGGLDRCVEAGAGLCKLASHHG